VMTASLAPEHVLEIAVMPDGTQLAFASTGSAAARRISPATYPGSKHFEADYDRSREATPWTGSAVMEPSERSTGATIASDGSLSDSPVRSEDGASSTTLPISPLSDAQLRSLSVARCIADIEEADFVALDLEFSGLFLQYERDFRPLDAHFRKCVESVPRFLALQLGVCCARKRFGEGTWELRAHEFNLWPRSRGASVFNADLASLLFLHQHGFDFNEFFQHHYEYARLPLERDDIAADREPANEFVNVERIVAALRLARVPLVVHNGLLDILHLYDKFVNDLPSSPDGFGSCWVSQFPFLFDTRYIAQEGRHALRYEGRLELNELHQHLLGLRSCTRLEHLGPLALDKPTHGSAGKDARVTAEVFLLSLEAMMREPLVAASTLRTHKFCQRLHNRVAVVNTANASCLHLGNPPEILLVPPLLSAAAVLPKVPSDAAAFGAKMPPTVVSVRKSQVATSGAPVVTLSPAGPVRSPPAPPPTTAAATPPPAPPPPPPPQRSPMGGDGIAVFMEDVEDEEAAAAAALSAAAARLMQVTNGALPTRPMENRIPKPRWAV